MMMMMITDSSNQHHIICLISKINSNNNFYPYYTITLSHLPPSHVRAIKVLHCTAAANADAAGAATAAVAVPAAEAESGAERLLGLLGGVDLGLQLGGALVDVLQLGEVGVEDADDLGDLYGAG